MCSCAYQLSPLEKLALPDLLTKKKVGRSDIEALFAEIAKIGVTLNGVAADVTLIKTDTTELKNSVAAIQTRRTEAESRISEEQVAVLAKDNTKPINKVDQLCAQIDDQENRARRKNLKRRKRGRARSI